MINFGITSYSVDAHHIHRCLSSIKNQTVRPDRIFIVVSDISSPYVDILRGPDLMIFANRLSAGNARNELIKECKEGILCFCDIDDEVHPQKCEIVKHIFNNFSVDMMIHSYNSGSQKFNNIDMEKITVHKITKKARYNSTNLQCPLEENMCHGPISIKLDTIKKSNLWYKDSSSGEDGLFCRSILTKVPDASIMYCPEKLINYIK
jgi:glycosyltransferase involved in cell wall biosynthesis